MPRYVTTPSANRLLLDGTLALSEIEAVGCRVDEVYLEQALAETAAKIKQTKDQLRADPHYAIWQRRFGEKTNVGSPEQMSKIVFGELGYKSEVKTTSGDRESASKKALEEIDLPFVKTYLLLGKLSKLHGTYLMGIKREMVQHGKDWFVHPSYALNTVVTFRSSCNSPNYTNIYKREPEYAQIVRRCYMPRRGQQIVELDYGGAEVKVCAAYTLDPVALSECNDPNADPHRDTAARMFFLDKKEVSKFIRGTAKGFFVFAQFYGDYYLQCAKNIWPEIQTAKVEGSEETILERLAKNGITELGACDPEQSPKPGTFEYHVKTVEDWYWNEKYLVHTQWKKQWWEDYQRNGGIMMKTGFAVNGKHSRNEIVNSPIQGSSFHCLLWSLTQIIPKLRKYKMKSRVIGEIHDALQGDCPPNERDDFIDLCREVMIDGVTKHWPWLNVVRLIVEPECCPVDRSWYDLVKLKQEKGFWIPEKMDAWVKQFGDWELQNGG